MDDQIVWTLRDSLVHARLGAQLLLPPGNHHLLIKRALDLLSSEDDTAPLAVHTVHNLPWPIKSIVEPNDGRQPLWATHTHLPRDLNNADDQLSPFIFVSRDVRPPTTKSLTFHFSGTSTAPVITSVYPGNPLPPLPWMMDCSTDTTVSASSFIFWRSHSFLYDKTIALEQRTSAPDWFYNIPSPLPLFIR